MVFTCIRKREEFDWFDGDRCANGQKKSADTVGSDFGSSGAQIESNERPKVPT